MHALPTVGVIVAPPSGADWSQVYRSASFFAVIQIYDQTGNAKSIGVKLLESIDAFVRNKTGATKQWLDTVVTPEVQTLIVMEEVGGSLQFFLRGKGSVTLKRGDIFAHILKQAGAVAGEVKKGDMFLLVSQKLNDTISVPVLSESMKQGSAQEIGEKLSVLVEANASSAGSAGLVVEIGEASDAVVQPTKKPFIPPDALRNSVSRLKERLGSKQARIGAAAVGISLVFIISVVLGIQKQIHNKQNSEAGVAITEAQRLFDEGVALTPLNPEKGRERLAKAKDIIDPLVETIPPRTSLGVEVKELSQKIHDNLTVAQQIYTAEPSLFFDVSFLKKGSIATSMEVYEDLMSVVDSTTSTVYTVSLDSRNGKIVGGGSGYTHATLSDIGGEFSYVLTDQGIHKIDLKTTTTKQNVIPKDAEWGSITSLVWFGGNIYLLDSGKGRIWKYVATETGFTSRLEYLNPDTLTDISLGQSMAVDGSVWVATKDGKIIKFTQGREDTFFPSHIDPPLGNSLYLYTSDDTKSHYVLDAQNNRVVVLAKDGAYSAQYVWKSTLHPTQLVVSETQKKLFLLSGGKIFALDLK